ncbi:MAG: hypothetical protein RR252_06200 [Longicatena sp.]
MPYEGSNIAMLDSSADGNVPGGNPINGTARSGTWKWDETWFAVVQVVSGLYFLIASWIDLNP